MSIDPQGSAQGRLEAGVSLRRPWGCPLWGVGQMIRRPIPSPSGFPALFRHSSEPGHVRGTARLAAATVSGERFRPLSPSDTNSPNSWVAPTDHHWVLCPPGAGGLWFGWFGLGFAESECSRLEAGLRAGGGASGWGPSPAQVLH